MMYFDVKASNIQELLEVLPVCHDACTAMLQKVQKHIQWAHALPNFGMSPTYCVIFFKPVDNAFNLHAEYHPFKLFGECNTCWCMIAMNNSIL